MSGQMNDPPVATAPLMLERIACVVIDRMRR
jgi:hypothetical protein